RWGPTASLRTCANTADPTKAHSKEVKDHSAAPHPHGAPANGEPAGAIRAHRRYSTCGTRAGQGAQARPAHAAADARRPAPEPSLGRAAPTVAVFTPTSTQAASWLRSE